MGYEDTAVSGASERGLEAAVKRLLQMRETVCGMTGEVRSKLDYLVGAVDQKEPPVSPEAVPAGILGTLEQQVGNLEQAISALNQHVGELSNNSRI